MSFLSRILAVFGIKTENLEDQFNAELDNLKALQKKSLQPFVTADEISPAIVLGHTSKIKELIVKLQRKGLFQKDDKIVNYTLSNIAMQESTITAFGAGYSADVTIYASQVGASLSEILKDITLLLN